MQANYASIIQNALDTQNILLQQLVETLGTQNIQGTALADQMYQFFEQMKKQSEQIYLQIADAQYREESMINSQVQSSVAQSNKYIQSNVCDQQLDTITVKQKVSYNPQCQKGVVSMISNARNSTAVKIMDNNIDLQDLEDGYELQQMIKSQQNQKQVGLMLAIGTSMFHYQPTEKCQSSGIILTKEPILSSFKEMSQNLQEVSSQLNELVNEDDTQITQKLFSKLLSIKIQEYNCFNQNQVAGYVAAILMNENWLYGRVSKSKVISNQRSTKRYYCKYTHSLSLLARIKLINKLFGFTDNQVVKSQNFQFRRLQCLKIIRQINKMYQHLTNLHQNTLNTEACLSLFCAFQYLKSVLEEKGEFIKPILSNNNIYKSLLKIFSSNYVKFIKVCKTALNQKPSVKLMQSSFITASRLAASSCLNKSLYKSTVSVAELESQISIHAELLAQNSFLDQQSETSVQQSEIDKSQVLSQTINNYKIALSTIIGQIPVTQPTQLQTALKLHSGFPIVYFIWKITPSRLSAGTIHKILNVLCSRPLVLLRAGPKFSTLLIRANTSIKRVKCENIDENILNYDEITVENPTGDKLNVFSTAELQDNPEKVINCLNLLHNNDAIDLVYSNCEENDTQKQIGVSIQELPLRALFYFSGEAHDVNIKNTKRLITLSCVNIQQPNLKDCLSLRNLFIRKGKICLDDILCLIKLEKVCMFDCEYIQRNQSDKNENITALKKILESCDRLQYFQIEDQIFEGEAQISVASRNLKALIVNFKDDTFNKLILTEKQPIYYAIAYNCEVQVKKASTLIREPTESLGRFDTLNEIYEVNEDVQTLDALLCDDFESPTFKNRISIQNEVKNETDNSVTHPENQHHTSNQEHEQNDVENEVVKEMEKKVKEGVAVAQESQEPNEITATTQ